MRALAMVAVVGAGTAMASDYQAAWGPPVGASMPAVQVRDQAGEPRALADLAGPRGTLLFVVRSADW